MKPIHKMTTEEKNQEVAEWLNLDTYWIWEFHTDACKIQLLREMMEREDWGQFKEWVSYYIPMDIRDRMIDGSGMKWEFIIDTTGKLLDAVLEFKRRNEK